MISSWRNRLACRWRDRTGRWRDRGSASVEVAVLAPAFIGLIVLAGVVGRTAIANEAIGFAAHDAARAASIARTADEARAAATEAAQAKLEWQGLACVNAPTLQFSGRIGGNPATFNQVFATAPGQDASVIVTVSCQVSFTDLQLSALPEMPTQKLVTATFVSPVDRYRARGG